MFSYVNYGWFTPATQTEAQTPVQENIVWTTSKQIQAQKAPSKIVGACFAFVLAFAFDRWQQRQSRRFKKAEMRVYLPVLALALNVCAPVLLCARVSICVASLSQPLGPLI